MNETDVLEIVRYVNAEMTPLLATQESVQRTVGGFAFEDIQEAVKMLVGDKFNIEIGDRESNDRYVLVLTR